MRPLRSTQTPAGPHLTAISSTIFQPFAGLPGAPVPPEPTAWVIDLTDADAGTLIRPAGVDVSYPAVDANAGTLIVR